MAIKWNLENKKHPNFHDNTISIVGSPDVYYHIYIPNKILKETDITVPSNIILGYDDENKQIIIAKPTKESQLLKKATITLRNDRNIASRISATHFLRTIAKKLNMDILGRYLVTIKMINDKSIPINGVCCIINLNNKIIKE